MKRLALLVPLVLLGAKDKDPCPSDMVYVPKSKICIDRFEWPNQKGERPAIAMTAVQSIFDRKKDDNDHNAEALCASVGKRLCQAEEWTAACRGPKGSDYPFGSKLPRRKPAPDRAKCNYAQNFKEPDGQKVFDRDPEELERLNQSDPAGDRGCVSASGAEDMMGNAEEWVRCPKWASKSGNNCVGKRGTKSRVCYCLMGRYWSSPEPCYKMIAGHAPTYHDYETGFRCCLDPSE